MGKKDSKHSNSSDGTLFRDAVADAQPLKATSRHSDFADRKATPFVANASARQQLSAAGPAEVLIDTEQSFARTSVNRKTLRDLKRGKLAVRDELDLHGLTSMEAGRALSDFIDECRGRKLHCVRIIHGKGLRSGPQGPVLRGLARQYLQSHAAVLAYCERLLRMEAVAQFMCFWRIPD